MRHISRSTRPFNPFSQTSGPAVWSRDRYGVTIIAGRRGARKLVRVVRWRFRFAHLRIHAVSA